MDLLGIARRAWFLLEWGVMVFLAPGCFWPPTIPDEAPVDAGANHIPVIVESNPKMPGPLTLDPVTRATATFTVDIEDRDVDDLLYVSLCRDFSGSSWDCQAPFADAIQGGAPIRTIGLRPSTWCDSMPRDFLLVFDLVVADRAWDPEMPWPTPSLGGASSFKSWVAYCTDL